MTAEHGRAEAFVISLFDAFEHLPRAEQTGLCVRAALAIVAFVVGGIAGGVLGAIDSGWSRPLNALAFLLTLAAALYLGYQVGSLRGRQQPEA